MLQKPDPWGILFNIFQFFLTVYCWSTYYTTYYQELFQLCNKWATYTGGAWPWMQFSTYLGYFPSFSAPKCRKVLSENSCHGVCSSNRNCPLIKILWDRRRYHWKLRVSWLRFWNHNVNWKPAKQTVGENTTVPLKIITIISTLI